MITGQTDRRNEDRDFGHRYIVACASAICIDEEEIIGSVETRANQFNQSQAGDLQNMCRGSEQGEREKGKKKKDHSSRTVTTSLRSSLLGGGPSF